MTKDIPESDVEYGGMAAYSWYVIGLLSVVNVFNYLDRMALSVLLPGIKADLELSDGQLGLLIGFAFAVLYAICGIPIARWADRGIRKNIIALAVATWSAMTALSGAAQNFWHLFLARVGVGIGEAGGLSPAQSIICDYVPVRRRAGAFAIHSFGFNVGLVLGMSLAGWLGELLGWRWAFVALGLPGLVVAVIVKVTLREPIRGSQEGGIQHNAPVLPFPDVLAILLRCRTYRVLMLFVTLNGFLYFGLTQWLPSFYVRTFDMSMASVGATLGLALGIGAGAGMLSGGFLANTLAKQSLKKPLVVSGISFLMAFPFTLLALFIPSPMISIGLIALASFLWSIFNAPVMSSILSVVPPQLRATAASISIFFTSVIGLGLSPFCVGLLSDYLTPTLAREGLRYALLAPVALIPVAAMVLFAASKSIVADLGARQAVR